MSEDTAGQRLDNILNDLQAGENCGSGDGSSLLPSVSGVLEIAANIRELLFPGIHGPDLGTDRNLQRTRRSLLLTIRQSLRTEVERAMVHARRAAIRVFPGADGSGSGRSSSSGHSSEEVTMLFLQQIPELKRRLMTDVRAAFDGDPAAKTHDEILMCYPGVQAITIYRIAHELHLLAVPYLPRIMTEWAHRETGIDMHPGAKIGESFFIDHGTGVVIGETCEIGSHVTLYQGVTLGAWSFPRDEDGQLIRGTKRHPTLEDHVTVYSNATILGGTTVVGAGSQIGSSVSLNRSVPANTIVTIERPLLRFREAA